MQDAHEKFLACCKEIEKEQNLVENLQVFSELVILGDSHQDNDDIFPTMIERKMLQVLLLILQRSKSDRIVNTILESVQRIFTNVKFHAIPLLSHSDLNEFIAFGYNFQGDETLEFYINFLKILSQRMTPQLIQLFFNQRYAHFPLLVHSQKFCDHQDALVRITAHNILLNTLKNVAGSKVEQQLLTYLSSYPFLQILVNYSLYLYKCCIDYSRDAQSDAETLEDICRVFQDISSTCPFLQNILDNIVLHCVVLPLIRQRHISSVQLSKIFIQLFKLPFGQSTLESISLLLLSPIVPRIPIELPLERFDVTNDKELQSYCVKFFDVPPEPSSQPETQPAQQQTSFTLLAVPKIASFTAALKDSFSYLQQKFWASEKLSQTLNKLITFNLSQRLRQKHQPLEFQMDNSEVAYNQYTIFAIFYSENWDNLESALIVMNQIISKKLCPLTFESRWRHIIDLLRLLKDPCTTLNHYEHITSLLEQLIDPQMMEMERFFLTYVELYVLDPLEKALASDGTTFYYYAKLILENIDNVNRLEMLSAKSLAARHLAKLLLLLHFINSTFKFFPQNPLTLAQVEAPDFDPFSTRCEMSNEVVRITRGGVEIAGQLLEPQKWQYKAENGSYTFNQVWPGWELKLFCKDAETKDKISKVFTEHQQFAVEKYFLLFRQSIDQLINIKKKFQ